MIVKGKFLNQAKYLFWVYVRACVHLPLNTVPIRCNVKPTDMTQNRLKESDLQIIFPIFPQKFNIIYIYTQNIFKNINTHHRI